MRELPLSPPGAPPPAPAPTETKLRPELNRFVLADASRYTKVLEIENARKIFLSTPTSNASTIRLAAKVVNVDEARERAEIEVGDGLVIEATRPGETLSWTLYALPLTANDVLLVTVWK